jgi:hypothetical protein
MDSELSIDEIVTALHFSLEETLKISLGPFVDKFNSSRNQFNVVSDLLKQLPEYKEIIKHNVMLAEENRILKEYIRKQNTKNNTTNRIKLEISEKDDDEEEEVVEVDDEEEEVEVVEVDDEEEEVEVVEVDDEEEEVEVVEVDDEKQEEEVEEVEVDDEEQVEEVEEVEVVEVDDEEEVEEEVEEEDDDDEISNNDVSQTPRSVVNTNEENEDEDEEEEGLIEVVISGKDYFADNDEDGDIYEKISDDEPGDEPIGIFKEGVATFF